MNRPKAFLPFLRRRRRRDGRLRRGGEKEESSIGISSSTLEDDDFIIILIHNAVILAEKVIERAGMSLVQMQHDGVIPAVYYAEREKNAITIMIWKQLRNVTLVNFN